MLIAAPAGEEARPMSRSRKRKMPPKQILALPDAIQSNSPLRDYTRV